MIRSLTIAPMIGRTFEVWCSDARAPADEVFLHMDRLHHGEVSALRFSICRSARGPNYWQFRRGIPDMMAMRG